MRFIPKIFLYLALLAPLFVNKSLYFPFITGKALFFRSAVELAFLTFILYAALPESRIDWRKLWQPLPIAFTVFALLVAVTAFFGVNPQNSIWSNFERGEGAWQILHYWVFFLLTLLSFETPKEWRRFLTFSVLVSLVVTFYGLGQYFNSPWVVLRDPGRISGTLGNPSYFAAYLLFQMFFTFWLVYNQERKTVYSRAWFYFLIAILAVDIFALYQSFTRAALVAVFIGLVVGALLFFKRNYWVLFGGTAVVTATLVIAGYSFFSQYLYDALKSRLWVWQSALSGFIEKPFWGWGVENFPDVFDKYYNPNHYGLESWFDRAHNVFLDYLIAGGLPLLVAYLAIFYFYYRSLAGLKKDSIWVILALLPLVYLIQGMTLFEVLSIYLTLSVFLAFFLNYARWQGIEDLPPLRSKPLALQLILAVAAALVLIAAPLSLYFTVWRPLKRNMMIEQAMRGKDPQTVFPVFQKAIDYYSPVGNQETIQQLLLAAASYVDLLNKVKKEHPQDLIDFSNYWMDKYEDQFVGVKNIYLVSFLNFKAGDHGRAKRWAKEGRALVPTRLEFIKILLDIARLEKDEATITQLEATAKSLRPDLNL